MPDTVTQPAFAIRNLQVWSYAQGITQWVYRAGTGTIADVQLPGFFDPAEDMLCPGDTIYVAASDGGCWLFVDDNRGGVKVRLMAATS